MNINSKNITTAYQRENSIQQQNPKRKTFEELTLMDSFLFESATEKEEDRVTISKMIIERATGHKVKKLVVEAQKDIKGINVNNHGIRMDVYTTELDEADDTEACVYDIEPNNYYEKDIPRRNRYYQSLIDSKLLPTNTPYKQLPDLTSIWILPYDPFGDDRMVYTVKNVVTENNQIVYNDGVTKLYLYTKGSKGGSQKLRELLAFMEEPTRDKAVDEELLQLLNIVATVKSNPEERRRYMGIMGVIDYEKRDAYESGRAEGICGAIQMAKEFGADKEKVKISIMDKFALADEEAEEYMTQYWDVPLKNADSQE